MEIEPWLDVLEIAVLKFKKEKESLYYRHNQIASIKNTLAYGRYISQVPKEERPAYLPKTPNKDSTDMSRREWDDSFKAWKLGINAWYQKVNPKKPG